MGKIFRYECRRLLWNKFFIGLAVVLLLYGALVLHAVTILGVSHTAPFSPWSFGDYLSRMLPLLWIGMLFFLSLVGSAVVTILGLAIYEALFQALNVPANAYQDACGYMKIICCGTVFVFGYNAVCSILKGLGDSQTPLFFVGVATVLNVVLDVLLVGLLSMGTAGAAWATITAQGVSFMGSLVYLRRKQPGFSL